MLMNSRKTVIFLVLCVFSYSAAIAGLQVIDEYMSLNGTDVESKTGDIDQLLFTFTASNGYFLIDDSGEGCCESGVKSVSCHPKEAMHFITEEDVFLIDDVEIPSIIEPMFSESPEDRDGVREQGLFYLLPLLGMEPTGSLKEDFGRVMGMSMGAIMQEGLELEVVLWRDGEALRYLRSGQPGVELPRDIFYIVNDLPCDDSEYQIELRTSYPLTGEVSGEPVEITMPLKFITGVHVSCFHTGRCWSAPRLTEVDMIVDPTEELCPSDLEAWYYDGPDPTEPPKDAGESCFDVDYLTDFDFVGFPVVEDGGSAEASFPNVHNPAFEEMYGPWFVHNVLRNSAVRLLDTVNSDPHLPEVEDVEPLSEIFTESYDGVPLEIALQLEYLRVGRRSVVPDQFGGMGLRSLIKAFRSDYSFIRRPRFYVKTEFEGVQRVTLAQLLQTIAWETWDKEPAYEGGHSLIDDIPYLDLGELGPMRFMVCAVVNIEGRWRPLKAIVSAQAGPYITTIYGGCIFGTEEACNEEP